MMNDLYDGKFVNSIPLDGTAETESCDCDKIERGCWWYLPISIGAIVLAYAIGFVSAAILIH